MRLTCAAAVGAALLLAGCGGSSPSYADTVRPAIQTMARALTTYNAARPADVAATTRSCRVAADALAGAGTVVTASPPLSYLKLAHALSQAYTLALNGFRECASGKYPQMVQSAADLAQADTWIKEARRLDH